MATTATATTATTTTTGGLLIGTHDGTFHADEALAVYLLRLIPPYANLAHPPVLLRTRDQTLLDGCHTVVDVGGRYEHAARRYDHHQRGFAHDFGHGRTTKLSSAGLVYKHYGKQIIQTVLGLGKEAEEGTTTVDLLWHKMYEDFIEAIDAIDNGISQFPADLTPKYKSRTDLSARVGHLNPAWNEDFSREEQNARFELASTLVGTEFLERLKYTYQSWLPGRSIVYKALSNRFAIEPSGKIVLFEIYAPWKDHIFNYEKEEAEDATAQRAAADGNALYIIYPTSDSWRIQAVPINPSSFSSRLPLPEPWRGLRDDELARVSGVKGAVFVHASGFIGGCQEQSQALALARKAIDMSGDGRA